MTKSELMTGDVIVNRGGYLGVVLKEQETVLYQLIGSDELDNFRDDLTFDDEAYDEDYRDGDIMEVFRGPSFLDIDNNEAWPIYQRDEKWRRPTAEEIRKKEKEQEEKNKKRYAEEMKKMEEKRKNLIFIVSQFYYGNRTGTEVRRDDVDYFLRGICPSPYRDELTKEDKDFIALYEKEEPVDRQYIRVPKDENIVIVYDRTQEEKALREGRTDYISCSIPELGITLYTRCFACRIDENGVLQSLEDGDGEKYIDYFPCR